MPTFRVAADEYYERYRPEWKSEQHAKDWKRIIAKYALPVIGDYPVDLITRKAVQDIIEPIWYDKTETARRVHLRIKAVLLYCVGRDYISNNVADGAIDGVLPKQPTVKSHHRSLPYSEMPDAVRTIEEKATESPSRLCLLLVITTGCRSGEARGATWDEIDMESKTWSIPAERMKASIDHIIPLSTMAIDILERAKALTDNSGLVFPSPMKPNKPMKAEALLKLLKITGLHEKTDIHGFRTSFRTWAGECTKHPWEVCEMALAHSVGNTTEQSYMAGELLEKRVPLMQDWADFLTGGKKAKYSVWPGRG